MVTQQIKYYIQLHNLKTLTTMLQNNSLSGKTTI